MVVLDGYVARAAEPDGHAAVEVVVAGGRVVLVANVDEGRADEATMLLLAVALVLEAAVESKLIDVGRTEDADEILCGVDTDCEKNDCAEADCTETDRAETGCAEND